jgi:hypothetical protein
MPWSGVVHTSTLNQLLNLAAVATSSFESSCMWVWGGGRAEGCEQEVRHAAAEGRGDALRAASGFSAGGCAVRHAHSGVRGQKLHSRAAMRAP